MHQQFKFINSFMINHKLDCMSFSLVALNHQLINHYPSYHNNSVEFATIKTAP